MNPDSQRELWYRLVLSDGTALVPDRVSGRVRDVVDFRDLVKQKWSRETADVAAGRFLVYANEATKSSNNPLEPDDTMVNVGLSKQNPVVVVIPQGAVFKALALGIAFARRCCAVVIPVHVFSRGLFGLRLFWVWSACFSSHFAWTWFPAFYARGGYERRCVKCEHGRPEQRYANIVHVAVLFLLAADVHACHGFFLRKSFGAENRWITLIRSPF